MMPAVAMVKKKRINYLIPMVSVLIGISSRVQFYLDLTSLGYLLSAKSSQSVQPNAAACVFLETFTQQQTVEMSTTAAAMASAYLGAVNAYRGGVHPIALNL
jgi:hypothetical protein